MNVIAAMPVTAVNTELMGTAAATDIVSTGAGDFGDALKSMISEHNSIDICTAEVGSPAQQEQSGQAIDGHADGFMYSDNREILEKYVGYAQSEIIAMLLASGSDELDMLFDFDGFNIDNLDCAISELSQGQAYMSAFALLSANTVITPQEQNNAENAADTDMSAESEAVLQDGIDNADIIDTAVLQSENAAFTQNTAAFESADAVQTQDEDTGLKHGAIKADDAVSLSADKITVRNTDMQKQSAAVSVLRENAGTEFSTKQPTAESDTVLINNNQPQITAKENLSEQPQGLSVSSDIKAFGVTVETAQQEQPADEQSQSTADIIATKTVFGRRIEEKSGEAIQLAKRVIGTKSESDLDTEQKVTAKQTAQQGLTGEDSRTVMADRIDAQTISQGEAETPVKMTLNEVYTFISEKAVKPGKTSFTVILTPESLGKITVKMSSESGKLSVEILTETQSAKRLFEARANELVYNLKQNDVEVQSYKVETDDSQLFNQSFNGSSKNPYKQQQNQSGSQNRDEFERLFEEIVSMG